MTKEELVELGLTEEQIPEIFKLNGIDVNGIKAELSTAQTQLEQKETQLQEANNQIESFKDVDVDSIKQEVDSYKAKYEEAKAQAEADIAGINFEHELEKTISKNHGKNATAIKALLDVEGLKNSQNQAEDIQKAIEASKEEHDYLYGKAEPEGTGGSKGNGERNKQEPEKENYGQTLAKSQAKPNTDTSIYEI